MRIPSELQDADRLLAAYGRWAMDRFRRQHCASIEHKYRPTRGDIEDRREPAEVIMRDDKALDVQHAMQVVPMQYRRVLQVEYIPHRFGSAAQRRKFGIQAATWEGSHLAGLRMFWKIYCLRYVKNAV